MLSAFFDEKIDEELDGIFPSGFFSIPFLISYKMLYFFLKMVLLLSFES